jgi:hypothetical protein
MPYAKNKSRRVIYNYIDGSRWGFLISFLTIIIIIFSFSVANQEINKGRPIFSGIGIALGLLLAFSVALITLSKRKAQKILGFSGIFTILYFSRLLFIIGLISITIYLLETEKIKIKIRVYIKLFLLGILFILLHFISGQFKHLIGQDFDYLYSLINSLKIYEWFFEGSININNLGVLNNYFLGVELGAEVADCLNNYKFNIYNLLGTGNDILNGMLPSLLRPNFAEYFEELTCRAAIVKSLLVDLIRAFGFYGIFIFVPILWGFVRHCELMRRNNINNNSILFYSILGIFSVFLIRGSVGAFISFSIALYFGFAIINFCLNRTKI